MKRCSCCGRENALDAHRCSECGMEFQDAGAPNLAEREGPALSFANRSNLSETDPHKDWVTLVSCGTLLEADMVAGRLRASGIQAFVPDEHLMQAVGFNLNTYGYVRVQVQPKDYEAARSLLDSTEHDS